jgi:hypothetical protein
MHSLAPPAPPQPRKEHRHPIFSPWCQTPMCVSVCLCHPPCAQILQRKVLADAQRGEQHLLAAAEARLAYQLPAQVRGAAPPAAHPFSLVDRHLSRVGM